MKKRLLSAFMALALCLTLLPAPAWAAETENNIAAQANTANVAEVTIDGKTTQYATLTEAITEAQNSEGSTVKLLADVTTTSEIKVDSGTFTIDLNGKKWEGTDTHTLLVSGGNVTVTSTDGVGTITCSSNNAIYVDSGATVHVTNGVRLNRLYTMKNAKLTLDVGVIITVKFFTQADNIAPFLTGKALQRCDENGTLIEGQYKSIYDSYRVDGTGCVIVIEHKSCTGTPSTETPCPICGYDGTQTKPTEPVDPNPDMAEVNGTKYKTLAAAIQAANGADITLLTIVSENIVVNDNSKAGVILGNGATINDIPYPSNWVADRNGIPLTMEAGEITLKNGALAQLSASSSANVAIALKGGTLIVETTVTKIIGSNRSDSVQHAAIEATGGVLDLQGNTLLDGGLTMSGDARLKNKLTAGTFTNSGRETYSVSVEGSSQYGAVFDLLEPGYAFAKYDESAENKAGALVNGNVKKLTEDVIIVAHKHSIEEGQSACACGRQFEASVTAKGGVSYYDTIDSAFAAAHEGDTVTLLADITNRGGRGIFVSGGPYTLDLNGHRIEAGIDLMVGDMDGSGVLLRGELTVKDSSTNNAGYVQSLKLWNGDLTVESGSFRWIVESGSDSVGTITITGGTADEVKHTSAGVTFRLSGGTFKYVENIVSGKPGDLLADNRAFFNRDNNFVNGYDDRYQAVSDVVVKEHTHSIVDGVCACGFTCAHDWSDKNGVCKKTNCGYHCPHNAGAAEADGVWACNTCGQTVTAKVVALDGTTTYYADGRLDNGNVKSGLYFAIKAAKTGSTVAALGGEYSGGYVTGNKTLTLDVSNGKPIDGILYVGEKEDSGNKLIVRGSTEISYVIVAPGNNTLDLTGWTGRIGSLTVLNGGKATLNGGTFAKLNLDSAAAGSLLASGYAFQNADTGAYVEYSSTANMENVKVVKCLHPNMEPDEDGVATCEYCGKSGNFVASVDGNLYTGMNGAISYWLENGGTLKLYGDYTATDGTWKVGSGSHTINLNGHRMSVQGDGAFFKPTNNMHLTVTDGTERGQIDNILLDGSQRGSFTLESGYVGNLEMTGGAVVALKGGSVDELNVKNCSANTNLSIQGGSLGKLNINDWADGMHVSATGGSLGAYSLPSGKILADVLDHQYYATGTSLDKQVDTAQSGEEFVIKQAPYDFGSASDSKAANVPIKGSIPFRVDSPSGDATGYYDVMWYRRTNSGAEHMTQNRVDGVKVGDKLDVLCVITGADSPGGAMKWQVAVKDYTINVVPADLSQGAVVFTQTAEEFAGTMGNIGDGKGTFVFEPYGGNADSPTKLSYLFKVTYNGQPLKLDKDYTIKDSSNRASNAGTHTLTIEGKGNYTGTAAHQWEIKPYTLSKDRNVARIVRDYDGTTNLSAEKLIELGCFSENLENRNSKNPSLGADQSSITIRLGAEDFEVSNVKLGSAEAGDTTASFTIKLKPRPGQTAANFVFEDGTSEMTVEEVPVSTRAAFLSSSPKAGELNIANDHAGVYTLDLSALLPKLESPKKYGEVTYELGTNTLDSSYYDAGTAKIENGKLILPIKAVETSKESNIGTVTVKVTSGNIVDFTLTINVNATNKIVPTGEPTLSTETLTYGQALSAIKLSGKLHDNVNNKDVEGTFTWADGTVKPEVGSGTYEAAWKFTPTDGDTYAEADGTVTITVNKATPTGTPKYTAISKEGQTLADANLTAAGENKESLFKSLGTAIQGIVKWVESEDKTTALNLGTKVEQGKAYTWLFTPNDLANYNKLTGTIVLWAKPTSGGGGGGGAAPAPTPADADVITVKEDTKDNTTSKPGAETDTTTTTKTTVKNTTTETTKNEQGQDVSKTTASVSKDLGDKLLDQAVSNKSDTIEITVKSSDANNGSGAGSTGAADSVKATEVELPKATVNAIAKDTNADLVIKTDNGEVVLDNKTLETIAGAAKGDTVTIVVGENTQLKETQKPAEKIVGKNGTLFDLVAKIGEKHLHQFEGGKAYVTLPMPQKLKGKDVLVIYIDDNGLCKILNHSVVKIGAEYYIRFTTPHFSTFAVVDKDEAEGLIKEQNAAHVKELMQSAKFKVTTTKTSKKSVKVQVAAKSSKTMISDIKSLGYTVKYQFYRSTKKDAGYKLRKTSSKNSFISTKGTKGRKYYYKARVLVYDGKTLVAKSALRQCSYGARTWIK